MALLLSSSNLQLGDQTAENTKCEKTFEQEPVPRYTYRYRILKTILMTIARVSLGMNVEIIGSTYEDLRISKDFSYDDISTALVSRGTGMIVTMFFCGFFFDKLSEYADLLMALSGILLALRKKNYLLS